jgi:hypothetical protein
MLTLDLVCADAGSGALRTLRGLIAQAVSKGDVADYWVSLLDTHHRAMHRATLQDYPLWAEPTRAFLARCLDLVLQSSGATTWFPTDSCELTVSQWGTQRLVDRISFGDLRPCLRPSVTPSISARSSNGWEVMRWACAQEAFGGQELPEVPRPLRLSVYEFSGVKYCRTSELPLEARVTFERLQAHFHRPFVPAVPDAVYPWWLDCFLREELSRHEFERGERLTWS